jgi:ABC-type sugar transport system substrate-binding protein
MIDRGQLNGELLYSPFTDMFIKPDGSPIRIAWTAAIYEVEPIAQCVKMLEDYFPRWNVDPENYTMFDAAFDLDAQIGWYEDMMSTWKPDFIISHNVSAELMVEVCDKVVYEGGIPVFTYDCGIDSDAVTSFVAHKFEGPGGTDILGQWLIDDLQRRGYGPDNPVVVGELWGMREMKTAQLRSEGFHKAVDREPWINVIESVDTNWAEEQTATITADMVMAHPEIKAFFHHGCGGAGMVPGLESIGMLLPLDHPDHIVIASNDTENAMWDAVAAGTGADTFSTHGAVEPTDVAIQAAITHVIFGQPVESFYKCPFIMITADNIDTVQIGGVPPSAGWPRDRWDLWVPMDPEPDYGFPQPSLELRKKYVGY